MLERVAVGDVDLVVLVEAQRVHGRGGLAPDLDVVRVLRREAQSLQRARDDDGPPRLGRGAQPPERRHGGLDVRALLGAGQADDRRQAALGDDRGPPRGVHGQIAERVGDAPLRLEVRGVAHGHEGRQRAAVDDLLLEAPVARDVAQRHGREQPVRRVRRAQERDQRLDVHGPQELHGAVADAAAQAQIAERRQHLHLDLDVLRRRQREERLQPPSSHDLVAELRVRRQAPQALDAPELRRRVRRRREGHEGPQAAVEQDLLVVRGVAAQVRDREAGRVADLRVLVLEERGEELDDGRLDELGVVRARRRDVAEREDRVALAVEVAVVAARERDEGLERAGLEDLGLVAHVRRQVRDAHGRVALAEEVGRAQRRHERQQRARGDDRGRVRVLGGQVGDGAHGLALDVDGLGPEHELEVLQQARLDHRALVLERLRQIREHAAALVGDLDVQRMGELDEHVHAVVAHDANLVRLAQTQIAQRRRELALHLDGVAVREREQRLQALHLDELEAALGRQAQLAHGEARLEVRVLVLVAEQGN
mmetsp:Transcript_14810/g.47980  ORF Transcript_14810/g.47980 Transcript_14810/m.47980 type:complete len:539 (-) Transcript_14810:330-1946(-)